MSTQVKMFSTTKVVHKDLVRLSLNFELPGCVGCTPCCLQPHTFYLFSLGSAHISGPQAQHLLESTETANLISTLHLNPSQGSQKGKRSTALQIFGGVEEGGNQVSAALTELHTWVFASPLGQPSAVCFISSGRFSLIKKKLKEWEC